MFKKSSLKISLLFITALLQYTVALAQTTVKGVITDAKTGETLPYVSIIIPGTTMGASADVDGKYTLTVPAGQTKLRFTYVGYVSIDKPVSAGVSQVINIKMEVDASMLKEVTVKGRARYRNKDNPAVQLIRQVIANRDKNQPASNDYVEYEQYEKISFSLSNLTEKFKDRRIFKNYQFLFTSQDSASLGGKTMLPAYMEEKLSQVYFRKSPYAKKTADQSEPAR